ncbi:unnamed protein product, partial [Symbiodinium necroappetens]
MVRPWSLNYPYTILRKTKAQPYVYPLFRFLYMIRRKVMMNNYTLLKMKYRVREQVKKPWGEWMIVLVNLSPPYLGAARVIVFFCLRAHNQENQHRLKHLQQASYTILYLHNKILLVTVVYLPFYQTLQLTVVFYLYLYNLMLPFYLDCMILPKTMEPTLPVTMVKFPLYRNLLMALVFYLYLYNIMMLPLSLTLMFYLYMENLMRLLYLDCKILSVTQALCHYLNYTHKALSKPLQLTFVMWPLTHMILNKPFDL